jgi:WS/DGAT/MGAT family acyltransferase
MELMGPADGVFLLAETREHPMHVGGLSLFAPPEGAGPEFVREFTDALIANDEFQPTFRKHPAAIMGGITPMAWAYDDEIDVDYHVRRAALASPRRVRELLEMASRLHTSLLDRHRPLWELYVVEGLDDGRFAMYSKMHHALIDGISAMKLMQRTLSVDPDDREVRAMWSLPRRPRPKSGGSSPLGSLVKAAGSVAALAPSTVKLARAALIEQQLTLPMAAPRTMFNVKVGGARRCAAQSWSADRVLSVRRRPG